MQKWQMSDDWKYFDEPLTSTLSPTHWIAGSNARLLENEFDFHFSGGVRACIQMLIDAYNCHRAPVAGGAMWRSPDWAKTVVNGRSLKDRRHIDSRCSRLKCGDAHA
jgi:hypothetical protein